MYHDPELPLPKAVTTFHPRLKDLWLEALTRPERDMKYRSAQAIARAYAHGMKGLDAAVEPLTRELDRPDLHPSVALAVARALVELDARAAAPKLFQIASTGDIDLRELIEPALARWDHEPARAVWQDRLARPPYARGAVLAVRGLAAVKETKAIPRLRELALAQDVPPVVRLEAAAALAALQPAGSEADARTLSAATGPDARTDRLAAVTLLKQHRGDEAVKLLQAFTRDAEPVVAAVALGRLVEIDSALVLPVLDSALASLDANVRSLGVEVLFRNPTGARIRPLADRLSDPHPDVRAQARRALHDLAGRPEFKDAILSEGGRVLGGTDWRGKEQAAVLLAQLDFKPATARLVALLTDQRPEVHVAAAWGLRKLAVPDTLPAVLAHVQARQGNPLLGRQVDPTGAVDRQLAQLIQFLGRARYRQADTLLRTFIPPGTKHGPETRAAAAWALGLFHEGTVVPELVQVFDSRVSAVRAFDVEDPRVRRMCAVGLGRMKANAGLIVLRAFYRKDPQPTDATGWACGWAIEQITGERLPPVGTREVPYPGGFLIPAVGPDD